MAKKVNPKKNKPAAPEEEPKPSRGKEVFEQVDSSDENIYPFSEAVPEGFDFDKHKPLKKRDFKEEYLYYEFRAEDLERKAAKLREQAEESKKLGSGKARQKAKRLVKLKSQIAKLTESLKESGVDVESILASMAETETDE